MECFKQIADFGMSRDLEDENYYVTQGGYVPLKWTAPEVTWNALSSGAYAGILKRGFHYS